MHFENENLDSIKQEKEFEITLRSMLAQDESRNIGENIQWGFQRKFEKGDIFKKYKNFMGYTCVDGEIVIVSEQAKAVRKIFELYLQGLTLGQIKMYLESKDVKRSQAKFSGIPQLSRKCLRMRSTRGTPCFKKHIQIIL